MSDFEDELTRDVGQILNQQWSIRTGQVVPTTDDVTLAGGAVKLEATMLYADLARSTQLLSSFDKRIVAKIIKSFLACASKIIKKQGGEIRSFDGDRVMGVFIGDSKNTNSAKAALKINYAVRKIINPKLQATYSSLAGTNIEHCVGIDTGEMMVVRSGVRDSNDLIWVGHAANMAAKLSEIRTPPYYSYISCDVFSKLAKEAKYAKSGTGDLMWEEDNTYYKSTYTWRP